MKTTRSRLVAAALMSVLLHPAVVRAQQPAPEALTSLEVEVLISRFQGDKRISSVPYLLAVNAALEAGRAQETQLNMGTDVPVPVTSFTSPDAKSPPVRSFNYRSVGTSIQASAVRIQDGRFELRLSIDDSSVYSSAENKQNGPILGDTPVFRSFKTRNNLLLRDGQTREYTAATDRVSGEVVKVSVTLKVVK